MLLPLGITIVLVSTTLATPISNVKADSDEYKLPATQIPKSYKLDIIVNKDVFSGTVNTFEGTVAITFRVKEKTKTVKLHAPMTINSVDLKSGGNVAKVVDYTNLNAATSIRDINLESELDTTLEHVLTITYTGDIDLKTMYGFYKSSYTNEDNEEESMLATQFEPVSARQAFPCFDEPKYKATFDLSITYPKGYKALSNTKPTADPVPVETDQEKVTFETTPTISTYLIAFTVSKFDCTKGNDIESGVPLNVCSRTGANNTRKLAADYGTKVILALEDFTGIKFSSTGLKKMDQVAIPDFGAGAMENWGLVTYRERDLLYDDKESSVYYKQSIISVIAHEFAHQWFGDLVTCNWWDDIFLNEGFATYFEYFLLTQTQFADDLKDWEFGRQFIVAEVQPVLVDDGLISSKALTASVETPEEIHAKFDSIAYNKGGSIIRMMENFIGTDKFKSGLKEYLDTMSYKPAKPSDLLNALSKQKLDALLPTGTTLADTVGKWISEPGYPVVTVSSAQGAKDLQLKQERFLYDGTDDKKVLWNVPISYTTGEDTGTFSSLNPKAWLTKSSQPIENVFTDDPTWVILNNQQSAYYRVFYASDLLDRIISQLLKDHNAIDVLNRAQIVDDLFNFARASYNDTKYSQAFSNLDYLIKETDYYPWVSVINSMNFLMSRIGEDTTLGASLKIKILQLLEGVYKTVSFDPSMDGMDMPIYNLKRDLVYNAACRFGSDDCIENASKLFESYKNKTSVDKNLKKVVYCNGLRYSKDQEKDWEYLWNKYTSTDLSTEQVTILAALGCVKNVDLLKKYLAKSVDETSGIRIQDLAAVWSSVYTSSPEGIQAALEYFTDNYENIKKYYKDAYTLISGFASRITNQEQVDKLNNFAKIENLAEEIKSAAEEAIKTADKNLKWYDSVKDDLESYLPAAPSGGSSTVASVTSFVLIFITIFKFLLV